MPPSSPLEKLQQRLKRLPGLGYRSAERIALHLLVEQPDELPALVEALGEAARSLRRCARCGNLTDAELCSVCSDPRRDQGQVCVVERVPDLIALERSGAWRGAYHVLHGKLSPLHNIGPERLNLASLFTRIAAGEIAELVLALANDVEGEATCHYIAEHLDDRTMGGWDHGTLGPQDQGTTGGSGGRDSGRPAVKVTRIGFGLPSGGGVVFADAVTLKSALEGRRTIGP